MLPPGVADPIYTCELALRLGKSVAELGSCMSAHELTVIWPEFFRWQERERKRNEPDDRS